MKRTALVTSCLVIAEAAAFTLGAVSASAASPSGSVTIAQNRVTAKQAVQVSYRASHLGGANLYLQRDFGTKHVFKNIERLTTNSGSISTPGLPMGKYRFRLQATKGTRVTFNSPPRTVYVYGPVSLLTLCNDGGNVQFVGFCDPGTAQVGDREFEYLYYGITNPDIPNMTATGMTCRAASIQFAMDNQSADAQLATVTLTQSAADAQTATTAHGSVATLNASITSSDFSVNAYSDTGDAVYWNGTFSCWTPTGEAP